MADNPIHIEGLLAKIESTYRTDPTPDGTNDAMILSEGFGFSGMTIENRAPNLRENVVNGTLMPVAPGVPRGRTVSGTVNLELRGAGVAYAAGTRPEADPLIRASGYSSTVDATAGAEKVTYAQINSAFEGVTLWSYAAGNVYKINGCRCNMIWPIVAGELGILQFAFTGFLDTAPATAAVPAQTFATAVPQSAVGMSFTVGGWSPDIITGQFNSGANLVVKPSGNHSDGFSEVQISRFDPRVTFSAPTLALATFDPYADRLAATTRAIDWTVGGSQYNRADLAVASAYQVAEPGHEAPDEFTGWGLEYRPIDMTIVYD